jgi:hypothetical protein
MKGPIGSAESFNTLCIMSGTSETQRALELAAFFALASGDKLGGHSNSREVLPTSTILYPL